jgi:hypothetical protein
MTATELFAVASFALFSFADLRYRLVPAIEIFFGAALILALPEVPIHVALILLAFAWGWLPRWPSFLALPLLFYPPAWVVLLTGFGVRHGIIGKADLLAVAGLACLFPWPALILAALGLEVWRRFWVWRRSGPVPALPGMLLGLLTFLLGRLLFLLL